MSSSLYAEFTMLRFRKDMEVITIHLLLRWLCMLLLLLELVSCNGKRSSEANVEKTLSQTGTPTSFSGELTDARALSLRVLQNEVRLCLSGKNCDPSVFQLCGIKKALGYVLDTGNSDVILVGSMEKPMPALHLEDFVVALRNAWKLYMTERGNQHYYSAPGCSIDPDPAVLRDLQQIHRSILACQHFEEVQSHLDRWKTICGGLQKVRVMGIPADTRFAKIMVDADYTMKRIVDGTEKLSLAGFQSLADMTLNVLQEQLHRQGKITTPLHSMNRFWFFPGRVHFLESDQMLFLDQSKVVLLTEKEYVNARGEITSAGESDSLAVRFAELFSEFYPEISRCISQYAELEGLFRFVAIANALRLRDDCSKAGMDIEYLLGEYPLKSVFVNGTLPGRSNIKQLVNRTQTDAGYDENYLWLPTCGGVSIDVQIKESDRMRLKSDVVEKIRLNVVHARPSAQSLSWAFSIK